MDNYELENPNTELDTSENDVTDTSNDGISGDGKALVAAAILGSLGTLYFGVRDLFHKRKYKEEREKNALYEEAIRKHQAEIDELKSDKERRAYKDRLWEQVQANKGE